MSEEQVRSALATLGLSGSATLAEIKRAWKRQALSSHPDKSGQSNEKFLAIQNAHEALQKHARDPQRVKSAHTARRANFDRILEEYEAKKRGETLPSRGPQTDRGPARTHLSTNNLAAKMASRPRALGLTERPRAKSVPSLTLQLPSSSVKAVPVMEPPACPPTCCTSPLDLEQVSSRAQAAAVVVTSAAATSAPPELQTSPSIALEIC